jgi:cell division protein FtsL
MMRLNLMLLMAVVASALYLVRTQYQSRMLFVDFEKATSTARQLAVEHERLQVEKRGQATPLRVEKLAKEQLKMRSATPAITFYVTAPQPGTATTP